jgi:hypothetical protein
MIGNQTKGRGFRGLLNYLESQKDAKLIGGNMGGDNARALAREFKISRQLNLEADRVVYHASLSLPQGERLDEATWNEIANRYLEEMGFDSNQYVAYRHSNTQHDHIHICASRIRLDNGKIVHDSWDYKRSETIIRQLERDYGLQQTQSSHEKLSRNPSIGQQKRLEREQEEYINGERQTPQERPIKQQLQELIDRATQDKPTMPLLVERLQLQGVEVRHGLTRNGKSKGISYSWNDQKFSGTSLGAAYTWPGLQKHKEIDYQPLRDDGHIEHLLKNPGERIVVSQELKTEREDSGLTASPVRELERGSSQSFEAITAIVRYLELQEIEQSLTRSSLSETLPQLTEQLSGYQQQLQERRTAFDGLDAAIADVEQQLRSQKPVDAISDFIEQSVVESTLLEMLPQLAEQLSQYLQQSEAGRTAFDELLAAIASEEQLRSQRAMDAISDFIEQSIVESTLLETLPQLTEQLSQYRQQLQERRIAFDDLELAITTELQSHTEKRAISSISDYIEQSAVSSALTQTVLELTEQLSQYKEQLVTAKTTFNDLDAVLAAELQSYVEKRAISSISDYVEQSTVESALTETVLELTQQLSQSQQQLEAGRTIFNDLEAAIVYLEQLHRSQKAVDTVALNKAQTLAADKPKLKDNISAELYQYYSVGLQNLLVTDRDKEVAILALKDDKPALDVEEILQASPAGWTQDEARELVLIASNQLATQKSKPEHSLDEKQRIEEEFLAMAVPIAVELINWQLRESGENSLRFKRATLEKQGKELVFTHDERGEIFRVAVNRNQSGELEYSPINVGEVEKEDIQLWQKAERVLQQIIEEKQQQERRQSKGISL